MGQNFRFACCVDLYVKGRHDARGAERADPAAHTPWIFDREAADNDPRYARIEELLGGVFIANPAADLNTQPGCSRDLSNEIELTRRARTRAVEINDVQPGCAKIGEALRLNHRFGVVDGWRVEVALGQPHAKAVL